MIANRAHNYQMPIFLQYNWAIPLYLFSSLPLQWLSSIIQLHSLQISMLSLLIVFALLFHKIRSILTHLRLNDYLIHSLNLLFRMLVPSIISNGYHSQTNHFFILGKGLLGNLEALLAVTRHLVFFTALSSFSYKVIDIYMKFINLQQI